MAKRASGKSSTPAAVDPSMRMIVLHGKDRYRIGELSLAIASMLRKAHGEIEEFRYDGTTALLADVLDELRSYGLIQRHKLVILDNVDKFLASKGDQGDDGGDEDGESGGGGGVGGKGAINRPGLERYAESPVEDATLLMRAEMWRPGKLDKLIAKVGTIIKCEPIGDADALSWCIKVCAPKQGVKVEPAAAERLIALVGADCGRLENEIAKLAAYLGGSGVIDAALVMELVGATREDEVWSIQSPLAAGDAGGAIERMRELMRLSRQPDSTLILISWSFCDLMRKVHGAGQLLRQGVNPWEAGKQLKVWGDSRDAIMAAAKRVDPKAAAVLFEQAVRTDWHNKTGLGEPMRSLESLAVQIADTLGLQGTRHQASGTRH